jgi:hypothetical protein
MLLLRLRCSSWAHRAVAAAVAAAAIDARNLALDRRRVKGPGAGCDGPQSGILIWIIDSLLICARCAGASGPRGLGCRTPPFAPTTPHCGPAMRATGSNGAPILENPRLARGASRGRRAGGGPDARIARARRSNGVGVHPFQKSKRGMRRGAGAVARPEASYVISFKRGCVNAITRQYAFAAAALRDRHQAP